MMILNGDQIAQKETDLTEAFRAFDTKNRGYITTAELKFVLSRIDDEIIGEEDMLEMVYAKNLHVKRKINFDGKILLNFLK